MRTNAKIAVAVAALTVCGGASFPGPGQAPSPGPFASVPALFRLTPPTPGYYWHLGEVFNPASDRHFFFFDFPGGKGSVIWCRQYNTNGQPLSGFQKVIELAGEWINQGALAYNEEEKCMFLVWSADNYRVVKGMPLDNFGRCLGGARIITIKGPQRYNSALDIQVAWLPSVNRYAVGWTYADDIDYYSAKNGPYLTILNRDFTFRLRPKKVYTMTMRTNIHTLSMQPVGSRLLWTGREDGAGNRVQPLAFFTDFLGNVPKRNGALDVFYPGPSVKGLGKVKAAYAPDDEVILFYWGVADGFEEEDSTYALHYCRVMGSDGVFHEPAAMLPRRAAFQPYASVCYNSVEKRFFWVVQEYASYYARNPLRDRYKGKLWGYYMDKDGRLESKNGNHVIAPIPLTNTVSDPSVGTQLWGLIFNRYDNNYWTGYWRHNLVAPEVAFWGLIYR